MARREAVLRVSAAALLDFLKREDSRRRRYVIVENPLPDDVKYLRGGHGSQGDLLLVVQSDTFEDIPDLLPLPELKAPHIRVEFVADGQ